MLNAQHARRLQAGPRPSRSRSLNLLDSRTVSYRLPNLMRLLLSGMSGLVTLTLTLTADANSPIVQPGAPGEASRLLTAEQAIEVADTSYTVNDVRFMQDMIPHHQQALTMSQLAPARTNSTDILEISGRIEASQGDEVAFMEQWLTQRGEATARSGAHADHHNMRGMASAEQLAALSASSGVDFDRQFLTLMIAHHEGAIEMVEALMEQPGSAYDPTLFEFTNDVTNDQSKEIERMHELLLTLSDDPRAHLAAGLYNAEEAIWNLRKVAVLPRPDGFYDPANPADLPPERFLAAETAESVEHEMADVVETATGELGSSAAHDPAAHHGEDPSAEPVAIEAEAVDQNGEASDIDEDEAEDKPEPRAPLLSFSNQTLPFATT